MIVKSPADPSRNSVYRNEKVPLLLVQLIKCCQISFQNEHFHPVHSPMMRSELAIRGYERIYSLEIEYSGLNLRQNKTQAGIM